MLVLEANDAQKYLGMTSHQGQFYKNTNQISQILLFYLNNDLAAPWVSRNSYTDGSQEVVVHTHECALLIG